jgi:hypothetical protein
MGVERFAKGIAEQPRKANKPAMPSPCGIDWDCAILTGWIDQQKFHKAIYRHLYHDIGILHGKWALEQLTGIKALEHDPEKACPALDAGWVPVFPRDKRGTRLRGDHAQTKDRAG